MTYEKINWYRTKLDKQTLTAKQQATPGMAFDNFSRGKEPNFVPSHDKRIKEAKQS